jgi:hypothetical protein
MDLRNSPLNDIVADETWGLNGYQLYHLISTYLVSCSLERVAWVMDQDKVRDLVGRQMAKDQGGNRHRH